MQSQQVLNEKTEDKEEVAFQWEISQDQNDSHFLAWGIKFVNKLNPTEEIYIGHYYEDEEKEETNVMISFKSSRLLEDLANECKQQKLQIFNSGEALTWCGPYQKKFINMIADFLSCIEKIAHLGKENRQKIIEGLGLNIIADKKEFYNKLTSFVEQNNFAEAFKMAKSVDDKHVMWNLGQICELNAKMLDAYQCYQEIPKENLQYSLANSKAGEIMLQAIQILKVQLAKKDQSEEAKKGFKEQIRELQKKAFKCFLVIEDERASELYTELCGEDGNKPIKNMRGDADTLIAVADRYYKLSLAHKILEKKNAIEARAKELRQQLPNNEEKKKDSSPNFLKRFSQ